jgi:hypothetical protein
MKLDYTPDLIIIERVGEIERTEIWKDFSKYVQSKSLKEQAIREHKVKEREQQEAMLHQLYPLCQTSENK